MFKCFRFECFFVHFNCLLFQFFKFYVNNEKNVCIKFVFCISRFVCCFFCFIICLFLFCLLYFCKKFPSLFANFSYPDLALCWCQVDTRMQESQRFFAHAQPPLAQFKKWWNFNDSRRGGMIAVVCDRVLSWECNLAGVTIKWTTVITIQHWSNHHDNKKRAV